MLFVFDLLNGFRVRFRFLTLLHSARVPTNQKVRAVYFADENRRQGLKYIKPEEQSLEEFVHDALNGKLTPKVRSAPAPKFNTGPVKIVVGSMFAQIVEDPTTDCLIAFCNPFDPVCKSFQSKYMKLAKKLKKVAGLVVATLDVSTNDVPVQYNLKEQPAVYLVKRSEDAFGSDGAAASAPAPIRYAGAAEVQKEYIQFLIDNTGLHIPQPKAKRSKASAASKDGKEGAPPPQGAGAEDEEMCVAPKKGELPSDKCLDGTSTP